MKRKLIVLTSLGLGLAIAAIVWATFGFQTEFNTPIPSQQSGAPADASIAISPGTSGRIVSGTNQLISIYDTTGSQITYQTGHNFWNPFDSGCDDNGSGGLTKWCNVDPRVTYDRGSSRWIIVAGGKGDVCGQNSIGTGVGGCGDPVCPNTIGFCLFLAVSDTSDPASTYHYYAVDACHLSSASSGAYGAPDEPILAINGTWVTVATTCFNHLGLAQQEIVSINKGQLYTSHTYSVALDVIPSVSDFYTPINNPTSDDSATYLIAPVTASGSITFHVAKIAGAPTLTEDIATHTINDSALKSGGAGEIVPAVPSSLTAYCYDGGRNNVLDGSGDDDVWANGHRTLELATQIKIGTSTQSQGNFTDGGVRVLIETYDTSTNTWNTEYSHDGATNGTDEFAFPAISHQVVNGQDWQLLTLDWFKTGQNPTVEWQSLENGTPFASTTQQSVQSPNPGNCTGVWVAFGDYSSSAVDGAGTFVGAGTLDPVNGSDAFQVNGIQTYVTPPDLKMTPIDKSSDFVGTACGSGPNGISDFHWHLTGLSEPTANIGQISLNGYPQLGGPNQWRLVCTGSFEPLGISLNGDGTADIWADSTDPRGTPTSWNLTITYNDLTSQQTTFTGTGF